MDSAAQAADVGNSYTDSGNGYAGIEALATRAVPLVWTWHHQNRNIVALTANRVHKRVIRDLNIRDERASSLRILHRLIESEIHPQAEQQSVTT
ncbi:hypothetical protein [Rhodococcus opacus]|uniref:hypothetical protein n=1 Tax=Rhodococcus opacus TaxID=37919 RepID=UPI000AEC231D|nr:hypothetical protein [Rhodococcus opacus]